MIALKLPSLFLCVLTYQLVYSDDYSAPIQFTEEPTSIQFANHQSGYLHCGARATSSYSNTDYIIISWRYSNGNPVKNISKTVIVFSNGTLWFPPFQKLVPGVHGGKFCCVAKLHLQNRAILSKMATVNGVILKPFKVTVTDQYVVGTGGSASFTCSYPQEVSSYVQIYRWWIDKTIEESELSDHFVVHVVEEKHSLSLYYCVVVNLLTNETTTSNVAKLFIKKASSGLPQVPFEFSIQPFNKTTFVDENILFECLVVRKNVEYSWKHNNQVIQLNHRISLGRGRSLRIDRVSLDDRGNYTCTARDKNTGEVKSATAFLTVQAPLRFREEPRQICTSFESNVTFRCDVIGYPRPSVTWYRDAELIVFNNKKYVRDGNNLVLVTAWARDEGIYQCVATNGVETIHQTASLIVGAYPPKITKSFGAKILDRNTTLNISCEAWGDRKPTLSWSHDGKLITNQDGRVVLENFQNVWRLQISNVTAADSGIYRCEAKNRAGVNYSEAQIWIKGPAKITHISQNPVGHSRGTVNISCKAKGYPSLKITWLSHSAKDGYKALPSNYRHSVIPSSEESTLMIKQLEDNDKGDYICKATSDDGPGDRATAHLSVLKTPEKDELRVEIEGDSVTMTCIQGKVWIKDGRPIQTGVQTLFNIIVLHIKSITARHAGKYFCREMAQADIYKKAVEIVVITKPHFTNIYKPVYKVLEHHNIQLDCPVSGIPTPRVDWLRKIGASFQPIPASSRFLSSMNGTLVILNVTAADATDYTCIASNINKASRKSQLKVHVPAKIVNWVPRGSQDAGNSTMLRCHALGNPNIKFIWLKDQRELVPSNRVQVNNQERTSMLTIKKTSRHDSGNYTCIVNNEFGKDRRDLVLTIRDKPLAPVITDTIKSKRSITVTWKVQYDGNSPITSYNIYFKQSGQRNLSEVEVHANQTSYLIDGLIPNTNYMIYVRARNAMGLSEPSKEKNIKTVEDVPAAAPSFIRIAPRPQGFFIQWQQIPQKPRYGEIKGYYIKYREYGKSSSFEKKTTTQKDGTTTTLRGLKDYTEYEIMLQAYTSAGPGPNSKLFVERTNEGVPSRPPFNINLTKINSTTAFVSWQPPASESINGVLVGYNIEVCQSATTDCASSPGDIGLQTNITLPGLDPNALYVIKLAARTRTGVGIFSNGRIFSPDFLGELDKEEKVDSKFSSKIFYKDSTVLGTLIGVCLFIVIVIVVLVLLTKLGFKPGSKILQRSIETWRWFAAKRSASEERRRHRRSGGSSTDGHLGGSSSSLSQQASNTGSLFSLPRSSSHVTESGYITNFSAMPPPPFSNYSPGSNDSLSGSSDEGIGPEIRVGQQHNNTGDPSEAHNQYPPRSSNGTPAPVATMSQSHDDVTKRAAAFNNKRIVSDDKEQSSTESEKARVSGVPKGKQKVYVQALDHSLPFNITAQRPKYEDGHFIIGPDIDRILAYRPPRCYDSTSSEYSSSRDELAQAYEFGKLHHLDDFYGRPTLESASSSGETANSEKDGICHFTTELPVARPFLIPVAILPPPPNQRLRSRDRTRQNAPLKTYYEKDETLV